MGRGLFFALGAFALILGAQCLFIDQAVLRAPVGAQPTSNSTFAISKPASPQVIRPPEWAPWSLLAGGTVTILYAIALPKRIVFSG
jgi:hypothetical protein